METHRALIALNKDSKHRKVIVSMELARDEEHIEMAVKALLKSLKAEEVQSLRVNSWSNFKLLRDLFFASCFHVIIDEEQNAVNILPALKLEGDVSPREYKQ